MRAIIGIDPGTKESGWAAIKDGRLINGGIKSNHYILAMVWAIKLELEKPLPMVAIERLRGSGRAVGFETFQTVEWSGRFIEAYHVAAQDLPVLITRHEILKALGETRGEGSADARVRRRMIELYGEPGTRSKPGPTYGLAGHAWQALAVAHVAGMKA